MPYKNKADEAARSRRYRSATTPSPAEDPERRIRQLVGELRETAAKVKSLQQRLDDAEELRTSIFGLTVEDLQPPRWPVAKAIKGKSPHRPILFTSDFQFGEVVDPAEMDGMNAFDAKIFGERYANMIDKTLKWCGAVENGWGAVYPKGIIYLRGGDAISGDIHAELVETNDLGAVPAVRELVRLEKEGIRRLKERFGHVHVISIPGNHGRTTMKPRAKGYTKTNFETLLAWWLQSSFEGEPGYTFECPDSGMAFFEAEGWRFAMLHGDRMGAGGGTGFIGAPAPITKGHLRTRMNAAVTGQMVDYVLTGHLHTSMQLPRGFANGSMVGYGEYARGLNLEPDAAKQWLIFAHVDNVWGVPLTLSNFPRRTA